MRLIALYIRRDNQRYGGRRRRGGSKGKRNERWILSVNRRERESYMSSFGLIYKKRKREQIGWEVDVLTKKETHPPFQTQNELETNE